MVLAISGHGFTSPFEFIATFFAKQELQV